MTSIALIPPSFSNVRQYNCVCDGVTDDTANINNALSTMSAAGGGWMIQPALSAISGPITVPANCGYIGVGVSSGLNILASFSGSQVINIGGNFAQVRNMSINGPTSTYSSNPAADGIDITGMTDVLIDGMYFYYLNGWAIASVGTGSVGNTHITIENCYSKQCGQGIHILGNSGSGYVGTHKLRNCTMSGVQNGDCYLWEDIHDSLCTQLYGETTAGTGNVFHFKGAASAIDISVFDIGPYPGPQTGAIIQLNGGVNGNPKNVTISNGSVIGGSVGIQINAGTLLTINACKIFYNNTAGVNIANNPVDCTITGCNFNQNGSVAGSGRYDLVNASTSTVCVKNNKFMTPQGNTANNVNACINDTSSSSFYDGNFHDGINGGWNATNVYAAGGTPHWYQNMLGVSVQGIISTTTPSGSPYIINGVQYPTEIYVSGGTVSEIDIGGTNSQRTSGSFYVPPHTAFKVIYSVAPVVVVSTIST